MRAGFLFSQAVCFTIKEHGTSSFMTSALDALVFVKVCVVCVFVCVCVCLYVRLCVCVCVC